MPVIKIRSNKQTIIRADNNGTVFVNDKRGLSGTKSALLIYPRKEKKATGGRRVERET